VVRKQSNISSPIFEQLAGHWWQFVEPADMAAVSFVQVLPSGTPPFVSLRGTVPPMLSPGLNS
jgi:hypothetical protein